MCGNYTERELWVERGDMRIFGVLYMPEGASGDNPLPTVICSHILGGTHENSGRYASEMASRGYAAFAFDFCGGAIGSRSTGETTDSSIKTEAADLSAVLDVVRGLPEVDERNVFLFGQSQGGAVSAMVAAERPDDVAGLILLYPAFVIHGLALKMFGTVDNTPEIYHLWHDLGRIYAVDAIEYDFYEHIGNYTGPVLVFQGTADILEPKRYTDRAVEVYAARSAGASAGPAADSFVGPAADSFVEPAADSPAEPAANTSIASAESAACAPAACAAAHPTVDYEVFENVGHNFQGEVRQHVHDRVDAFMSEVAARR